MIEINAAVLVQIAKLHIELPTDVLKLWKVDVSGVCVLRPQPELNETCYIEVATKKWVLADDTLDFQAFHIKEDGGNNYELTTSNSNKIGFNVKMQLIILSKKKMAFPLMFEAIKGIGNIAVKSYIESYEKVTKDYFVLRANKWGINPDYRGLIIDYTINLPYIESPDYDIID